MASGWLNTPFALDGRRVWVAGHRGMVGSAMTRRLMDEGCNVLTSDMDLRRQAEVEDWTFEHKPDVVVLAAAKVGGILANRDYPADFLYDNMMIEANVIHAAARAGVKKLLFLGSSCIYPKDADQPIVEDALLSGTLEATNEAYAIAKIAGVKLCAAYRAQGGHDFISAMPCNLYGAGDRYDAEGSHVIPALMMRMHAAKTSNDEQFDVWGSGKALREFLYVDDLADALVLLLKSYSHTTHINIGSGAEITIADLAQHIAGVTGYEGALSFDPSRPDGVMRKVLDSRRIVDAGWLPKVALVDGLARAYADYQERYHARDAA